MLWLGLLTSFSPNYGWILFLRGCCGFMLGATAQGVPYYVEFLPVKQRAKCVLLLQGFWAIGSCMTVVCAMITLPTLGWRWFVAFCAVPTIIILTAFPFVPESARFYSVCGENEKAMEVLQNIADDNKAVMPSGVLVSEEKEHRGSLADVVSLEMRTTTFLLIIIWFVVTVCYYGIVLMTNTFIKSDNSCSLHSNNLNCQANCKTFTAEDYNDMFITTVAEFPGILLTMLLIDSLGRKLTMCLLLLAYAVLMFILMSCYLSHTVVIGIIFICRGLSVGAFQSVYLYTPEVYPTTIRATALGVCNTSARLGAMISPFIAEVLLRNSAWSALSIMGVLATVAAVASFMLPIETTGREMSETIDTKPREKNIENNKT